MDTSLKASGLRKFRIVNQTNDINNQIKYAQSEDSLIREVTINSKESKATECLWYSVDPIHFGLEGYNKVKLAHWNNGRGMTREVLDKVCDFSSSHGKEMGEDGNKGKGELLSGMGINSAGLVWVSCALDEKSGIRKVHRIVMLGDTDSGEWGRKQYVVEDGVGNNFVTDVVDITEEIDLEALELDIDQDWTFKIYCGVSPSQNTVKNPYNTPDEHHDGWLVKELSHRFPILPEGFKVKVGHKKLTNDGKKEFVPVLSAIKNLDLDYETVTVKYNSAGSIDSTESLGKKIPFFTEPNTVNVTYVYDPHCGVGKSDNAKKSTVWYKTRMGITGTWSGVIYKGELFDYRGVINRGKIVDGKYKRLTANTWRQCAPQIGVLDGYDQLRVYVSLPVDKNIRDDENRVKLLRKKWGRSEEVQLKEFRDEVLIGMPQWFKDTMQSLKPDTVSEKDIQDRLSEVMKKMQVYDSASRDKDNEGTGIPKKRNKTTHNNHCLECKKNNVITVIPRGVRKCPVCGWIKPKKESNRSGSSKGLYYDTNGKLKMKKIFPTIELISDEERWREKISDPSYAKMAAEYYEYEHTLFVNQHYDAFVNLTNYLLEDIDENHMCYEQAKVEANEKAKQYILYHCLGIGLANAFTKYNKAGYKEDENKELLDSLTKPQLLTVYTDSYFGNPTVDNLKKSIKSKFKIASDNTVENTERNKRWHSGGVILPVENVS